MTWTKTEKTHHAFPLHMANHLHKQNLGKAGANVSWLTPCVCVEVASEK